MHIDQWNGIRVQKYIHTSMSTALFFLIVVPDNSMGKAFLIMTKEERLHNTEKTVSYVKKKKKLDHFLIPYTKIRLKWIKPKYETRHYKTPKGKYRQNTF